MTNSDSLPFLSFDFLPRFADITPAQVESAVDTVLAGGWRDIEAIVADSDAATWDNTIAPLENAGEQISRVWNQVEQMYAVMNTPAWRDAYSGNLAKIIAYYSRLGQHEKLYRRIETLMQSAAFSTLSATRQKIIADMYREFKLSGVGLDDDKKEMFRNNSETLAALGAKFEENIIEATKEFSLIACEEDLAAMPADLRAIAAAAAADNAQEGYRFTLQQPSYMAFMQYCSNRAQREQMYKAYVTRASEFGAEKRSNAPLVADIMTTRQQQAALLGYDDYAAVALESRMAPSVAAVLEFLHDFIARVKPYALSEIATLKQFAAEQLEIDTLAAWDINYVSEKLRRAQFDFSDAEVRQYLCEDKILQGLFDCLQQLFGVQLREKQGVSVWHDDVRFMELCDDNGNVIGGVYLDLYARADKRSGAWMADALSHFRRGDTLQLPLAHVICNFSKPVTGQALLNWDEVVTLFHEFGHAMHHLLTEIEEYSASGISGVEWDAVELPSQWLENYAWEWEVLQKMTCHCDSKEPMPRALFDKITAARRFHCGLWLIRQLEFALFDMLLHDGKSLTDKTPQDVLQQVRSDTAVLDVPAYNRFYCSFSHIFAGGYAAGYYSYLWAEMLAADAILMFKESGDVLNSTLGRRFRREILAVGGSRPAMESFIALRGSAPNINALLAHYGLTAGE